MDCLFGQTTPLTRRFLPALVLVLILSGGCGGGGGGGGEGPSTQPPPPPTPVDTAPPVFSGVQDTTIDRGEAFDPLEGVSATDNVDGNDGHVFHIAIDHGSAPDGAGAKGQYAYVVVPNVAADDMPGVMTDLLDNLETINTGVVQGHRYADGTLDLVQLAFYSAGTAPFADGLTVNLPDRLDAFDYDYREEFHAGMPAVVDVP